MVLITTVHSYIKILMQILEMLKIGIFFIETSPTPTPTVEHVRRRCHLDDYKRSVLTSLPKTC